MRNNSRKIAYLGAVYLCALAPAWAQPEVEAPREIPRIILPGAPMTAPAGAAPRLILPETKVLTAPPSGLVMPEPRVLRAPAPRIVRAARPLTEAEAAPEKLPGKEELAALAKSLSAGAGGEAAAPDASRTAALDAAFDGALAPEARHWDDLSARFSRGPRAPDLPAVGGAARSLIARLLPALYKRVPTRIEHDRGPNPSTGHTWSAEGGHLIELAPTSPDARGDVDSAFGLPGRARVQQKIEHLMEAAHEYLHVIFDAAVGRKQDHPMHSAYAAVTEGFAVGGEQLLVERLLDRAPSLGLAPRDTTDLSTIGQARREWLDAVDSHYAEGLLAWRDAYAKDGEKGLLKLLAALSADRMAAVPRSDSAYQLALGDSGLLAAYLGRDAAAPGRAGLEAFAKAARGETLTAEQRREAAAAVERAGPRAWRRVFERTLLADKRLAAPGSESAGGSWFEKDKAPDHSVEPAFALAALSPAAGRELARFLAQSVSTQDSARRLFERPGPSPVLSAIATGAESLPWDPAGRRAWDDGLTRWLLGSR